MDMQVVFTLYSKTFYNDHMMNQGLKTLKAYFLLPPDIDFPK